MASRRFSRIEELYHAALGRQPGERDAFLEQACGEDEELLREVRSLLGYEAEAERLLEQPVSEAVTRKLALLRGARLGPYEVVDRIGSGGMGEVYRARDTRLGREVAIKVLPEERAGDAAQLRRFEREARSAAALNHPNIATIYEVGDHDGTRFIAMELIEGQTLKDRLEAGRLSVKELLDLASQIARGLAKAHASGIVHRDLKPGNLMVTSDGLVKILDFGLARRMTPTTDVASGITREGMVLGTVQYMSPEQAAARPHDHRSDQFSFGAILYEMATGKRAFERDTAPQTLAAILEDDPEPLRTLNAEIPARLSAIVERCLAKDPANRYDSTADLVRELAVVSEPAVPAPASPRWRRAAMGLALVALVAAFVVSRYASGPKAPAARELPLEAVPFTSYPGREVEPTFSPDGSHVAFTWDGASQDNHDIYVKAVGAEQPHRLTTDPARDGSPAWSPDGTRIAFLRDAPGGGSEVRLIPPTGGPERRLAEVQGLAHQGLTWSPDGRSLAVVDRSSPGDPLGIFLLDAATGVKRRLSPPSARSAILPSFSPDGRTVAFSRTIIGGPFVHVVPVAGGEPRELVPTRFPRGRLAWIPGAREILFAAVPVAGGGGQPRPSSAGRAAASLWRVPADGGQARPLAGSEGAVDVAVSGDGRRLVYSQETLDWDIWRLDLRRRGSLGQAQTRFLASTKDDVNPQFSPDGERVAFTSTRSGNYEIWVADGQGGHLLQLTSFGRGVAGSPRWSPDGRMIAFDFSPEAGDDVILVDIYVISASGGPPRRVTTSPAIDATPTWSRDGRWIYFGSNRTGEWQVWKVPSSGEEAGSARQVTRGGGFTAIESTDGRYVYFARRLSGTPDPQNSLWRMPVDGGDEEVVIEAFRSTPGSWDLTAEGIYFVDQRPSTSGMQWVVRSLAFGQRHATDVARLRHPPFLGGPAISVSSDGRWMLSTQSQGESDLMLVEAFR